jgi:glutamyl/glutaminyl-tRNA synthetase
LLTGARAILADLGEFPTPEEVKTKIWDYATLKGRGQVLWPLRVALTGKDKSPDPFIVFSIIGKTEALKRIDSAIVKVS